MPNIGDIGTKETLGRKGNGDYIWQECIDCKIPRWTRFVQGKVLYPRCQKCANKARIKTIFLNLTKPTLGEVRNGLEIGRDNRLYIWVVCEECGYERWVRNTENIITKQICWNCWSNKARGENNVHWNGGVTTHKRGYRVVSLSPTDFYYPMGMINKKNGTSHVFEHRIIMAKHLGRLLLNWEVVHHKNGIKNDNRLENLELSIRGGHIKAHSKGYSDGYISGLNDGKSAKIKRLEAEIINLKNLLRKPETNLE